MNVKPFVVISEQNVISWLRLAKLRLTKFQISQLVLNKKGAVIDKHTNIFRLHCA